MSPSKKFHLNCVHFLRIIFDEQPHLELLCIVFRNDVVSLIFVLFGHIPDNGLTLRHSDSIIDNDGYQSVFSWIFTNRFGVGFLEELRLVLKVLFNSFELIVFLPQRNVSLSRVRTDLIGYQRNIVHALALPNQISRIIDTKYLKSGN